MSLKKDNDVVIDLLSDDDGNIDHAPSTRLQVGFVLEEDLQSAERHPFLQESTGTPPLLYHDEEFESAPPSIQGENRSKKIEKCRCQGDKKQPVQLRYIQKGPNKGRPYHGCHLTKSQGGCIYFRWAFQAENLHWYRFGPHTGHTLVQPTGFSAQDLVQGKVGDCWFLSALAVVAERPDLIQRLFESYQPQSLPLGLVQVNLFLDGFWKTVTIDNFLPCIIDDKVEMELQKAIHASMGITTTDEFRGTGNTLCDKDDSTSSKYDPFALSDKNRQILTETQNLLNGQLKQPTLVNPYTNKKPPPNSGAISKVPKKLNRVVTTEDLAYSKARHQQLWVPFLEKAYAKSHGCYQAISGGWMAEAFLDLTGAPTLHFALQSFHNNPFDPKSFWYKLLSWRDQRLPMACATAQSQVGLIGMHAYSILDVREIKKVQWEFFQDKLRDRSLGNVSGFTEFDGTVRLLRIRNPHGQGEWKGEFSDQCDMWEKLLIYSGTTLERSMKNDGTFWIDYDSFLLGFSHVDVVLAFSGNHARSFETNFPEKKSNQRCTRAFEVSLLDDNGTGQTRDTVELYVMGIQKTKRGASHGRADRKVSYKICDLGMLVGEGSENGNDYESSKNLLFSSVQGEMFGFHRNGHTRLILDRRKNSRLIVMPVSFGHPAATDKERSFVVRFVADAPLFIRELPALPRLDRVIRTYCFEPQPPIYDGRCRRLHKLLLEGQVQHGEPLYRVFQIDCSGVVFVYLCVHSRLMERKGISDFDLHLSVEATCRGMMCRTETGFLTHETLAKGKKYEAAWRKFSIDFCHENQSRLLMVLVQAGKDCEMGAIVAVEKEPVKHRKERGQTVITSTGKLAMRDEGSVDHEKLGIFNGDSRWTDEQYTSIFGPNPVGAFTSAALGESDLNGCDLDLENALALSRGDHGMQEALELSKQDINFMSDDQALHLVLERSKTETGLRHTTAGDAFGVKQYPKVASTGDDDLDGLNEAIKRSLKEIQSSSRPKNNPAIGGVVVDLLETDDSDSCSPKPGKRKKTVEDVVEIMDIDDGERAAEVGSGAATSVAKAAEKRSLAAEAAERRFQSKQNNY